jgi:hypothetical protein
MRDPSMTQIKLPLSDDPLTDKVALSLLNGGDPAASFALSDELAEWLDRRDASEALTNSAEVMMALVMTMMRECGVAASTAVPECDEARELLKGGLRPADVWAGVVAIVNALPAPPDLCDARTH